MEKPNDFYAADDVRTHPEASPIHGDLTGLPPLLIQVGAGEFWKRTSADTWYPIFLPIIIH